MSQYLMLGLGGIVLLVGLYFKKQFDGMLRNERIFAMLAYVGWVFVIIPGTKMISPLFSSLPESYANMASPILQVVLFIVGAELLLKKSFDPNRVDTVDPTKKNNGLRRGKDKPEFNSYGSFKKKK